MVRDECAAVLDVPSFDEREHGLNGLLWREGGPVPLGICELEMLDERVK